MTGRSDFDTAISRAPASDAQPAAPSAPLLAAAIGGLLCLSACGDDGSSQGDVEQAEVTLERLDPDMTEAEFKQACELAEGKLETHSHCGGMNSCKGFSYDRTTSVYSEHTCKGLNECTGWSCVVPDDKG